ncbi:MAG TPA: DUF3772 domain-containing protein [Castellaniella sp.]|nr:DUF3772 domain-containing protein [Castellaniella sp.]
MRIISKLAAPLLVCLALLLGLGGFTPQASAQSSAKPAVQDVSAMLDKTQTAVTSIQERLEEKPQDIDDASLVSMRDTLQQAQSVADEIVAQLEPELEGVQARVNELGTPDPEIAEPADIAQQRAQLTKRQSALDAQVKLARLLGVDARQGQEQITTLRRARFQAELGERSQSLLTSGFWRDVVRDAPRDVRRLKGLLTDQGDSLKAAPPNVVSTAVVLALLVLVGGAVWRHGLAAFTIRRTRPTRLRRSVFAVLTVALHTLVPGLLATILLFVLRWEGELGDDLNAFLKQATTFIYVGGFIAGLGTALLSPSRPSWRLPALADSLAHKLAWVPFAFALTITLAWTIQLLLDLINAALITTLLVNGIMTVTLNILIGFTAWSVRSSLNQQAQQASEEDPPRLRRRSPGRERRPRCSCSSFQSAWPLSCLASSP